MNQQKIGGFIASQRKQKNMTQAELAEKLGITDRAVSKWETGKCMPDPSLYKSLCEMLGITINELINGEFIKAENVQTNTDENIVEIIRIVEKLKRQKEILVGVILIAIGIVSNGFTKYTGGTSSNFGQFVNGLSLGLSVGMELVGIVIVVYGIAKSSRQK